jgi:ADP-heptose:LPS heptosyltransferase
VTEGRVLVVQLARLGDQVQTWPLLRRLRHQDPGLVLELLADSRLTALHPLGPPLDRVWELDLGGLPRLVDRDLAAAYGQVQRLAADLRARRYELIYNLNFSRLSLLLASLGGSPVKGYQPLRGGREYLRDPRLALVFALVHARQVNRVHLSDVFRHLAPAAPGEPRPPAPVAKSGEPIIALQLATKHPKRTWPVAAFARLANLLVERLGARIWLLGTKEEAAQGERLRTELTPAHRERVVNLQGRTDLKALAERLRQSHVLVSGDTGTLHLAAALGTRTVGMFLGPASCFETGPYGEGHYVFQAEPPCHPCTEAGGECPEPFCQTMISPEAAADLVVFLSLRQSEAHLAPLSAGVRLYRSFFDPLGVSYAPLGAGYRFIDLVGQAYRRAAASLWGVTWPAGQFPPPLGSDDDWRNLERLAAALRNGDGLSAASPALVAALTPLQAFREEIHKQRGLGRDETEAQACLEAVEQGFRAGIEQCSLPEAVVASGG